MTEIQRFMLPDEMKPVSHYCHVTRAGDRVWVSGTVGVKSDGTIPEDTAEQFQVAIDALAVAISQVADPGAAVIPEGLCLVLMV